MKKLLIPFATHCRHKFFYSCRLFDLIGMVEKVEVISTFATAVCECLNVSEMVANTCLQPSDYMETRLYCFDFHWELHRQIVRLQLHGAIYGPDSFVLMLRYCANLKAIKYESTSLNRIVADKWHHVIVA